MPLTFILLVIHCKRLGVEFSPQVLHSKTFRFLSISNFRFFTLRELDLCHSVWPHLGLTCYTAPLSTLWLHMGMFRGCSPSFESLCSLSSASVLWTKLCCLLLSTLPCVPLDHNTVSSALCRMWPSSTQAYKTIVRFTQKLKTDATLSRGWEEEEAPKPEGLSYKCRDKLWRGVSQESCPRGRGCITESKVNLSRIAGAKWINACEGGRGVRAVLCYNQSRRSDLSLDCCPWQHYKVTLHRLHSVTPSIKGMSLTRRGLHQINPSVSQQSCLLCRCSKAVTLCVCVCFHACVCVCVCMCVSICACVNTHPVSRIATWQSHVQQT